MSVNLTSGMRRSLLDLNEVGSLIETTQMRLSTGKKINSVLDDPTGYFKAKGLYDRADDLMEVKDSISSAISSVGSASSALGHARSIMEQMKSLASDAQGASAADATALELEVQSLSAQLDNLLSDSSMNGVNLLTGAAGVTVNFSDSSSYVVDSANTSATALTIDSANIDLTTDAAAITTIANIEAAIAKTETLESNFVTDHQLLQTRLNFTESMMTANSSAADDIVLADPNEEAANLLALQVRQQLVMQSMSFAAQSQGSILNLFR